ncbi:hypothetical protein SAMN05660282_00470 [Corynebacterium spheniscorum]|uniref:Uncharacterized protein n=1 Tax=Corynebacterium spheniscorum TaxID=185761 RepID=A0A1I2QPC8_9CORY|nr:hypothetical protein SAMN05660282_00470 [Corynebacterium spheniscorum]
MATGKIATRMEITANRTSDPLNKNYRLCDAPLRILVLGLVMVQIFTCTSDL